MNVNGWKARFWKQAFFAYFREVISVCKERMKITKKKSSRQPVTGQCLKQAASE